MDKKMHTEIESDEIFSAEELIRFEETRQAALKAALEGYCEVAASYADGIRAAYRSLTIRLYIVLFGGSALMGLLYGLFFGLWWGIGMGCAFLLLLIIILCFLEYVL